MKINHFLQLIILFFGILWSNAVFASPLNKSEAEKWARNKGEEIIQILTQESEDKFDKINQITQNDIDLDYAAQFVVGKYWKQMTDEQKQRYSELFKKYAEITYRGYDFQIPQGSIHFTVDKSIQEGDKVEIFCTIIIDNLEKKLDNVSQGGFKVSFILVKNNNRIQVRDLKVDESSTLIAFRQRFYKMIHEDADDEIDWFLTDLETIVNDNSVSDE